MCSLADLMSFLSLKELKKHNAKDVVRVCDPTYKTDRLKTEGINVLVSFYGRRPPNDDIF